MRVALLLTAALALAGCAPTPPRPSSYSAESATSAPTVALEQSRTAPININIATPDLMLVKAALAKALHLS